MDTTISATDLARGLSDVLNRVRYRGERFIIDRNGEPTALLAPIEPPAAITMREFIQRLGDLP
jgi:prevent-host-death family protein